MYVLKSGVSTHWKRLSGAMYLSGWFQTLWNW